MKTATQVMPHAQTHAVPHALWHDEGMDDERRKTLRRLGRTYRTAMEAEAKAREALATEVLAAVDVDKEPPGEVAREIGFDREWIRRARENEKKRLAKEAATPAKAPRAKPGSDASFFED